MANEMCDCDLHPGMHDQWGVCNEWERHGGMPCPPSHYPTRAAAGIMPKAPPRLWRISEANGRHLAAIAARLGVSELEALDLVLAWAVVELAVPARRVDVRA